MTIAWLDSSIACRRNLQGILSAQRNCLSQITPIPSEEVILYQLASRVVSNDQYRGSRKFRCLLFRRGQTSHRTQRRKSCPNLDQICILIYDFGSRFLCLAQSLGSRPCKNRRGETYLKNHLRNCSYVLFYNFVASSQKNLSLDLVPSFSFIIWCL